MAATAKKHAENRGYTESRKAGLKPFQPGKSGNPGGRPKAIIGPELRRQLEANPDDALVITNMLITMARRGDMDAIKFIVDRIDGPLVKKSEVGEPGAFDDLLDSIGEDDARRITLLAEVVERKRGKTG